MERLYVETTEGSSWIQVPTCLRQGESILAEPSYTLQIGPDANCMCVHSQCLVAPHDAARPDWSPAPVSEVWQNGDSGRGATEVWASV